MNYGAMINTGVTENVEIFFKEYATNVKKKTLKDLRGKIQFRDDYNYKLMREKG